jgi:hypothetical protein
VSPEALTSWTTIATRPPLVVAVPLARSDVNPWSRSASPLASMWDATISSSVGSAGGGGEQASENTTTAVAVTAVRTLNCVEPIMAGTPHWQVPGVRCWRCSSSADRRPTPRRSGSGPADDVDGHLVIVHRHDLAGDPGATSENDLVRQSRRRCHHQHDHHDALFHGVLLRSRPSTTPRIGPPAGRPVKTLALDGVPRWTPVPSGSTSGGPAAPHLSPAVPLHLLLAGMDSNTPPTGGSRGTVPLDTARNPRWTPIQKGRTE